MSYTGRLVIDADSVAPIGQQPPPSGGAELTLDDQDFHCTFREDFAEDFDTWRQGVYDNEPDPASPHEQRWCTRHTVGSFGTDGIQFLHPNQTPNPNDLFDIIDGQFHMRVRDDVRANPGDWAGTLLSTAGTHIRNGFSGFRQSGGYWEVNAKLPPKSPTGGGHWCAFWLLSQQAPNDTRTRLIDGTDWTIPRLEVDFSDIWLREPTVLYPNAHYRRIGSDNLILKNHNHTGQIPFDTGVDMSADFHRHGVWLKEREWVFYFDRQPYATVHLEGDSRAEWARNRSFYLLMDHTIDTRGGTELPVSGEAMIVDEVCVFKEAA